MKLSPEQKKEYKRRVESCVLEFFQVYEKLTGAEIASVRLMRMNGDRTIYNVTLESEDKEGLGSRLRGNDAE